MSPALQSSIGTVGYLALFAGVGVVFLFANLLLGRFLRPSDPHKEKLEIYECGEPTIGSSFVQFDLRFYVVALLFIIFDVEVAFFFPWATVFGKATHMMDSGFVVVEATADGKPQLTKDATLLYKEMGVRNPVIPQSVPASLESVVSKTEDATTRANEVTKKGSRQLAFLTIIDIAVFFGVLLVGFAYVWKRGDLDWVRAVSNELQSKRSPGGGSALSKREESVAV